ncbi:GNAT family N-acetyltransferase [Pararcticibacter amylolyticus]|uniref:GNAT family N-acetyltransferase n=1 Tax=Pararcticibacter amylolyticus TaxID=2173175 RepID=UPI001304B4F3|nr:GNAT family N-acetyltransferase [Pararcticibacter amylolyticus]
MLKIKEKDYDKVALLLDEIPFNTLFARAVTDGIVKGEIYVDSIQSPRTAYIVHPYGMSLLCGDPTNYSFNEKLLYYLLDTNAEYRKRQEWLQVYPLQWEEVLAVLVKDKLVTYSDHLYAGNCERDYLLKETAHSHIIRWNRLNFKFVQPEQPLKPAPLPDGFELKRIDASMLKMAGSVVPQFFWNSYDDFLANGVAFGVVRDGRPVSIAFSAYIKDRNLEIGIETDLHYRGKGFALQSCHALINYCLDNDLTPVWSCRKENTCSLRLAEKLGFHISGMFPYYSLPG